MRFIVPILSAHLVCLCAFAQSPIAGTVTGPAGAPIQGAKVRLEPIQSGTPLSTTTGPDGRFLFPTPPNARALLTVEAMEFQRVVRETTPGENNLVVALPLKVLSQQVTVTAALTLEDTADSARAVTVIDRSQLDQRLDYSLAEALREVPGMRVTQLGGPGGLSNIRLRGLRPQDTAILLDGFRLRDPAGIQGDATSLIADLLTLNLSRLEVLRGCGSAMHGSNAIGGAVNLLSDTGGGPFRGDFLAEGGGLGILRSHLRLSGQASPKLLFSLGGAHVNVRDGVDGYDPYRNTAIQSFLQFRPQSNLALSARLSGYNSFVAVNGSPSLTAGAPRTGAVNAIVAPNPGATVNVAPNDPDSSRTSWLTSALFAADHQLSPRLNYRVAWQLVDSRRRFPNGPGGTGFQPTVNEVNSYDARIDTLQARLNYAGNIHLFSAGAEWERESFLNTGRSLSTYTAQIAQRSAALFAEHRIRLLQSKLQLTFSGRFQDFRLSHPKVSGSLPGYLTAPIPNPPRALTGDIAAAYRFAKTNTKLRSHIGNAYRAPSLYERYGTGFFAGFFTPYGDPRLSPERATGFDAGIDQYFAARRLRLSATYFYTQLRSVIGFDFSGLINRVSDPFGRSSGYFNTAGGLSRGVEVEGQAALWRGFNLSASYTHTNTLERRPVAQGTLRTPRIYPNAYAINATQTLKKLTLTANYFHAPTFQGVIFGRAINWEGPRRLDATASYKLNLSDKFQHELFVRAENLLNQNYFEDGYRTPRFYALTGLRLNW